jgi:hypothetical protein
VGRRHRVQRHRPAQQRVQRRRARALFPRGLGRGERPDLVDPCPWRVRFKQAVLEVQKSLLVNDHLECIVCRGGHESEAVQRQPPHRATVARTTRPTRHQHRHCTNRHTYTAVSPPASGATLGVWGPAYRWGRHRGRGWVGVPSPPRRHQRRPGPELDRRAPVGWR